MVCSFYSRVFAALLERCVPCPGFAPPWDFLRPLPDWRGPVPDPAQTLHFLRRRFSDRRLARAGVLRAGPEGAARLAPELCALAGPIIPLRTHPARRPYALLTPRGALPGLRPAALAALHAHGVARALGERGVLLASPNIGDVALLLALGLPATLSTGLLRLTPGGLRAFDARFSALDLGPFGRPRAAAPERAAGRVVLRGPEPVAATLAWVGWSVGRASDRVPPALAHPIGRLAEARQHLGLTFAGVLGWRPGPAELENLRFRLGFRDPAVVRELLQESSERLVDFEELAAGAGAAIGAGGGTYQQAHTELLAALEQDPGAGPLSQRAQRARSAFDAVAQRDLIAPLQEWALRSKHPVARSAGAELATVAQLLHRMGPLLLVAQGRRFERARAGSAPVPATPLQQYLTLTARLGALIRDLIRLRGGGLA